MKIINHPVPLSGTIECLGMTEKPDRPEDDDLLLQQLWLEGKVEIKRGINYSWLDTKFQQHFGRIEYGDTKPHFVYIDLPGYEVKVRGFGDYECIQTADKPRQIWRDWATAGDKQ